VVLSGIFGLLGELLCFGYIRLLRTLCASDEEENQQASRSLKVDSVAWPVIDAQFADSLTNRLYVSEVAEREAANADLNASQCLKIAKFPKPSRENFGLTNLDHVLTIVHDGFLFKSLARSLLLVEVPPDGFGGFAGNYGGEGFGCRLLHVAEAAEVCEQTLAGLGAYAGNVQ
jgi:hypothetical protein